MDTDYVDIQLEKDGAVLCHTQPQSDSPSACEKPTSTQNQNDPVVIGNPDNFWLWREDDGFDLTHPPTPTSEPVTPRVKMEAFNAKITIAPEKTALIIVDLQNYWLSEPFAPHCGPAHDAEDVLLKYAIPASRKVGIQVVWLNWGFAEEDLKTLPPTTARMFSFHADGYPVFDKSIGSTLGRVKLANGEVIEAGKFLMRDQWNTALHGPSEKAFQDSLKTSLPDVKFRKIRITGMTDIMPDCVEFLTQRGIKTLLFAGCNTDVCVFSTLQDASLKGFDCVMLSDGTGTSNGEKAQWAAERNCRKGWGFLSTCVALEDGVNDMNN